MASDQTRELYAGIGPEARPVGVVWVLPQAILIFSAAILVAVITAFIAGVVAGIYGASIGMTEADFETPPGWFLVAIIVPTAFAFFGSLMMFTLLKVKLEKRSLASAGLVQFLYGRNFWKGFLGGAVLAFVLMIPGAVTGGMSGTEAPVDFNFTNVLTSNFLLLCIGLFLFVLVQSPAEEVLFRGWMLSGLAARSGLPTSIILTSLLFALVHADRFSFGVAIGTIALIATGCLGFLFAAVSRASRSVLPAAGMHSGYNFILFILIAAYLSGIAEDGNLLSALQEMLESEVFRNPEANPSFFADLLGRIVIPLGLGAWFLSKRDELDA